MPTILQIQIDRYSPYHSLNIAKQISSPLPSFSSNSHIFIGNHHIFFKGPKLFIRDTILTPTGFPLKSYVFSIKIFGSLNNIQGSLMRKLVVFDDVFGSPMRSLGSPINSLGSLLISLGSPMKSLWSPMKSLRSPRKILGSPKKIWGIR